MNFIDYYPFADRVLTFLDAMIITEREYQILKKISKSIKETTEKEINDNINQYNIIIHHIEKSIRNSNLINNSTLAKEIIIANILLPEDIDLIDLLNKNGFTYEALKDIIRFRSLLKNIISSDTDLTEEIKKQFKEYKENIKVIIDLFKEKYNITDQTIILNRICELLVRKPNSFESKKGVNTKKR